jgi:hypothetical protein
MGLLNDPNYRPEWDRQPANDKQHPYVGLLDELYRDKGPPPESPEADTKPDYYPYAHRIPAPVEDDRAYRMPLEYDDSLPGQRDAQRRVKAHEALLNADMFRQPKRLEELEITPYSTPEKLLDVLRQWYQPNWMAGK